MWYANPDGAGFMYADEGHVHIEKGFMSLKDFNAALERLAKEHDLTTLAMVMHFRITTHGGTKPENTHPFPITDNVASLKKLHGKAKIAVAHNGIIDITPRSKDISDTMEYVASQLAPLHRALPEFYKNKHAMLMVSNAIQSKMVFLTGKGELYTIGKFETEDGMLYSNTSYTGWYSSWRRGSWSVWDTGTHHWKTSAITDDLPGAYDDYSGACTSKWDGKSTKPVVADGKVHYEQMRLMPLWAVEGYVRDPEGEYLDGDEFYVDSAGLLWWYDFDSDTAIYCGADWYAFDREGLPPTFDLENTELVWCYVD